MSKNVIPFSEPYRVGDEINLLKEVLQSGSTSGEGPFNRKCRDFFSEMFGGAGVVMTPSCTASLELAALAMDLKPGDEVILPSFTFPSTATAIALRGAIPVFVDCRWDTFNLDEGLVEQAITSRTRAIMPVDYAGVSCDMRAIRDLADRRGLVIIEDAAQGAFAEYDSKPVGFWADFAAISFHETKNIGCGEGGALIVRDREVFRRVEVIKDKGTNRSEFIHGLVNKYEWKDIGSSFLMSEFQAAVLWSQLQQGTAITEKRREAYRYYYECLQEMEKDGRFRLPVADPSSRHNAHIFAILLESPEERVALMKKLNSDGIQARSHYVPLHSAPAGLRYGRVGSSMEVTDAISSRLLRLPLFSQITREQQDAVVSGIEGFFSAR